VNESVDRGAQAERTTLAHVRTWLGVLVVALLLARQGGHGAALAIAAGAAAVVVVGLASAVRVRRMALGDLATIGPPRRTLLLIVVAVAAMQLAAIVTLL
jgi:hypothetical protein